MEWQAKNFWQTTSLGPSGQHTGPPTSASAGDSYMTDKSCKLLEANSLSKCPCHSTVAVNLAARMTVCKLQYAVLRCALRSVFRQVTFNLNELKMNVPIRNNPTWPAEAVNATPLTTDQTTIAPKWALHADPSPNDTSLESVPKSPKPNPDCERPHRSQP